MGRLREQLRLVWYAFFGRFGSKPNDIQRDAMPKVLAGHNVVICAPTASGKTEAIMAPLSQRLLESGSVGGLRILYITPTRALAYDLRERLTAPLTTLGLGISVKTFERSEFDPNKPKAVLITTPEGFDSLLARHPEVLESVMAVVLDELHLIDNTYRGDQVRVLLKRLQRLPQLKANPPRFYALSATFEDPREVAARYFDPFVISQTPGQRALIWDLQSWPRRVQEVDALYAQLREQVGRSHRLKLLAFANSRDEVENLAQLLQRPPFEKSTFAHHAKLSASARADVEEAMKSRPVALCVATSTLEIGIDIGDIDMVLLFGTPPSVSSLLQRVGRGNRRSNTTSAIGFFSSEEEHECFRALFERAKSGLLEKESYTPKLSVAVQQIFSYLFQRRKIKTPRRSIIEILEPLGLDAVDVQLLLDHLESQGFLKQSGALLRMGDELEKLGGAIHSNIPEQGGFRVLGPNGQELGWLVELAPVFFLHGKAWEIQRLDHEQRIAHVKRFTAAHLWQQRGVLSRPTLDDMGRYFPFLPSELQKRE